MPLSLPVPPPLTYRDGLSPYSANSGRDDGATYRLGNSNNNTSSSNFHTANNLTTAAPASTFSSSFPTATGYTAGYSGDSSDKGTSAAAGSYARGGSESRSHIHPLVWAGTGAAVTAATSVRGEGASDAVGRDRHPSAAVASSSSSLSSAPLPSAASTSQPPPPPSQAAAAASATVLSSSFSPHYPPPQRESVVRAETPDRRSAAELEGPHGHQRVTQPPSPPAHAASPPTHGIVNGASGGRPAEHALNDAEMVAVPLPVVVEQQAQRIREILYERDTLSDQLRELRQLFQRLSDDYDGAVQESNSRQLRLDTLETQRVIAQEEAAQLRAVQSRQEGRIVEFEAEWAAKSSHLRSQLEALMGERDDLQQQRDLCLAEASDLRRQVIELQGAVHTLETKHREALQAQADAHSRELRAALLAQEEALQARAAATRHEARLTQQQMLELSSVQTAAVEDRDALRWRLRELEGVLDRKESLRQELARMVDGLRAQVSAAEQQGRQEAERYAARADELERTYRGHLAQEQHRAATLSDELATARRGLQEAHRQLETVAEESAARTRALMSRAAQQEEGLREELRGARAELVEAQAAAARHEAAAHRSQREAESLRAAAASAQAERQTLLEAQAAQQSSLLRLEGSVEVLKARLREKEKELELLRCATEHGAWTRELQESAQHTLAAALGVPRAVALQWWRAHGGGGKGGRDAEGTLPLQLEWAMESSASPPPAAAAAREPAAGRVSSAQSSTERREDAVPRVSRAATGATAQHETVVHENMADTDALESPRRPVQQSSQAAAATAQHIESIERTVARHADGQGRSRHSGHTVAEPPVSRRPAPPPSSSPISVLQRTPSRVMPHVVSSPSHGPPLYPNSTHANTPASPPSFAAAAAAVARTKAGGQSTGMREEEGSGAENTASDQRGVHWHTRTPLSPLAASSTAALRRGTTALTPGSRAASSPSPHGHHQYNVTQDNDSADGAESHDGGVADEPLYSTEKMREGAESGLRNSHGLGSDGTAAGMGGRGGHAAAAGGGGEGEEEVFFDGFIARTSAQGERHSHLRGSSLHPSPVGPSVPSTATKTRSNPAVTPTPLAPRSGLTAANATVATNDATTATPVHPHLPRQQQQQLQQSVFHSTHPTAQTRAGAVGGAVDSATGARAAELIAQLTPFASSSAAAAAAASVRSTPLSSAASHRQRDRMPDSEGDLQRYLQETVQAVLASQRLDGLTHPLPLASSSSSSPVWQQQAPSAAHHQQQQQQRLRGHSHYTELYAGSPLRSVGSAMTGDEDDFGSVSRPRSVVLASPAQPHHQLQHLAQSYLVGRRNDERHHHAAAAAAAGTTNQSARAANTQGQRSERHLGADAASPPSSLLSRGPHDRDGAVQQGRSRSGNSGGIASTDGGGGGGSSSGSSTRKEQRKAGTHAHPSSSPLTSAGVASTLEQLARRQQQVLASLVDTAAPTINDNSLTDTAADRPDTHAYADATQGLVWSSHDDKHRDVSAMNAPVSDVTSSEPALDPRQLSYATTAATTHMSDTSRLGGPPRRSVGPLAAEWRVPAAGPGREAQRTAAETSAGTDDLPQVSLAHPLPASRTETPSERRGSGPNPPSTLLSASTSNNNNNNGNTGNSSYSVLSSHGSQRFSKASETELFDDDDGQERSGAAAVEHQTVAASKAPGLVEATDTERRAGSAQRSTVSVGTSVSQISSLTQLEKQFAEPFVR